MTEQEAIDKLDALTGDDKAMDHIFADKWVREFLWSSGYKRLADAYERASKRFWYS